MNVGPIIAIPPLPEGTPATASPNEQAPPPPPLVPEVASIPAAEAARRADPDRRRSEDHPDDEPHAGHVPGDDPPAHGHGHGHGAAPALSSQDQMLVATLRALDAEVRAHEQAHIAAGGGLTGGATYEMQIGPDGQRYAVGGEVSIDTRGGANPHETIRRMQQVRAAALAPAVPSSQDLAVASAAARKEAAAMAELAQIARETRAPRGDNHGHDDPCGPCTTAIEAYVRNTDDALTKVGAAARPKVRTVF